MENSALVVIDMQNDFIDGVLGSPAAEAIVPLVRDCIKNFKGQIIYATQDVHDSEFEPPSVEKRTIPEHCMIGTDGYLLEPSIETALGIKQFGDGTENIPLVSKGVRLFQKQTFGCEFLMREIKDDIRSFNIDFIYIVGLCTDICVISNALMIRAACPNVHIVVYENLCAGTSPENHQAALEVMNANCIDVWTYTG